MGIKDYDCLSEMQLDALREIGNIGSGNAASALSTMLDKPVDIAVPRVSILEYTEVVESLGGPEELYISLLLSLSDDVTGMIIFLLRKEFAYMVINTLLGTEFVEDNTIDEMGESAIREVGNIMAASYINAIADLTGLRINLSVPSLSIDMAGAILSVPAIYFANISDKIIFIDDDINNTKNTSASRIILIPEVESLQKIMTSLGLDE